ncbi:RagB/SusD family nutrient uptake outer membrane protein [Mucilaginibacter jinjuensis]|uniref:RagB/SusD family nutrient uptake outer membrane protein n=1 Tax=Mucilaginibacter jinjuensis TaxID=1176721 RepID=A0ABY7T4F8_9SPHI|nr:RagB/SusD family nutrient uptake outer membrane protein [Mucilaginibacter jinjuensis]WCT10673.1 RagB/SusD family nutrient uptake outer membrane protein [Mucilaginibacter jinjuensis]
MKRKYIYSFLVVALSLGASSCKKYLDEKPNNLLPTDAAITDAGTARAAIIGTYDRLQNYYASNYPTLGVMPADNVIFNGTLNEYLQLDQNAVPVDNVITVAAYQNIYKTINSANSVIAAVPGVNDPLLTSDEKNKILGEAYFIRALSYFDLGRGWGGVQLQLTPTTDLNALKGVKRSTLDQTYDQVLADLTKAEQLLPEDASTRNRAQKSVARALRARLHLYRQQWSDAENYATQVISNTKYALVKPYNTFFTAPFLSTESVFELTFSTNDKNSYWNLWYPSSAGGQYTLKPSDALVAKLNNPNIGGTRKTLIAGTGAGVYGVLYNTTSSSIDPSYVIRIAELYLIRAEARAQQNNLSGAIADLNTIRARAGVPATTATTQADVLQAIEDENSVEFPFEAHRWFDLVRTGRAGAVLGLTNKNYWLFPISYSDILSDPDVTQNPGY